MECEFKRCLVGTPNTDNGEMFGVFTKHRTEDTKHEREEDLAYVGFSNQHI